MVTNQRWIRKWTYWSEPLGILFADKNKRENIFKTFKGGYQWAEPRTDEPPPKRVYERKGKSLQEWAMGNLLLVPLREVTASGKSIRFTNRDDIQRKYLQIDFGNGLYTLFFEDGERLFQLLQVAESNNGRIPLDGEATQKAKEDEGKSVMQRLQQLEKLREAAMITEDEYQKKREEILSSL